MTNRKGVNPSPYTRAVGEAPQAEREARDFYYLYFLSIKKRVRRLARRPLCHAAWRYQWCFCPWRTVTV